MQRKFYLISVAGGTGTRMGTAVPKQFLEVSGKPILCRTIEAFMRACPETHVVTVLPESGIEFWKRLCMERNFNVSQTIVAGGMTRFHSVLNALAHVPDGALVAIHDGVRPLVSPALIKEMIKKMDSCRALIPVLPSVDSIAVLHRDSSGELQAVEGRSADRTELFRIQTPQMFLSEELKAAYTQPYDPSFTDDSSVAKAYGIPLSFIEGERFNVKITTPEDLDLAQVVLNLRGQF